MVYKPLLGHPQRLQFEFMNLANYLAGLNNDPPDEGGVVFPGDVSSKVYADVVVGTSLEGWTADQVDYLCDGTADDVEINAALVAAGAGGAVKLLGGAYSITSQIIVGNGVSNAHLYGEGIGVTVVTSASDPGVQMVGLGAGGATSNLTISDLTLNGGNFNSATIHTDTVTTFPRIIRVEATNTSAGNIWIDASTDALISECKIHNGGGAEVYTTGARTRVENSYIANRTGTGADRPCIQFGAADCVAVGNTIVGACSDSNCRVVYLSTRSIFVGNNVTGTSGNRGIAGGPDCVIGFNAINLTTNNSTIDSDSRCRIIGNTITTSTQRGIWLNSVDDCLIQGNYVDGAGSGVGIVVDGGNRNIVTLNKTKDWTTEYTDSGTGTKAFANYFGTTWTNIAPTGLLTTKGDVLAFSTAEGRFPVGADGKILESRASETFGLKWVDPPTGAVAFVSAAKWGVD